jgi:hypothetical protein
MLLPLQERQFSIKGPEHVKQEEWQFTQSMPSVEA